MWHCSISFLVPCLGLDLSASLTSGGLVLTASHRTSSLVILQLNPVQNIVLPWGTQSEIHQMFVLEKQGDIGKKSMSPKGNRVLNSVCSQKISQWASAHNFFSASPSKRIPQDHWSPGWAFPLPFLSNWQVAHPLFWGSEVTRTSVYILLSQFSGRMR